MASMFETIRSLPLLKGITEEQVAEFLEHTNVRFTDYVPGQFIVKPGDEMTDLSFVINGAVRISYTSPSGFFTLHHTPPSGHPLFAYRLFGLSNTVSGSAKAVSHTTILSFPKSDYLNLLCSDHIYQIGALNYLSARVQHSIQAALSNSPNSLALWMARLMLTLTPRGATDVFIEISDHSLQSISGLSTEAVKGELSELHRLGLISHSKNTVNIINRNELIDRVLHYVPNQK